MRRFGFVTVCCAFSIVLVTAAVAQQHEASTRNADVTISPSDKPDDQIAQPVSSVVETLDLSGLDSFHESDTCGCKSNDAGKDCCCSNCDCKKNAALAKTAAGAYKGVFYNNNFEYLCDPCYCDWLCGEDLKRRGIGHCSIFDFGGQFRMRQMARRNDRGLGLTGVDDDFLLYRTRLYMNLEVGSRFRAYAEYIDAVSNYEDAGPLIIDENRSDFLNLFGDLMLYETGAGEIWARAGRQELLYGAQRTVSPLDWANTRRTFEGYKVFYKGSDWNVDTFYTRPIVPNKVKFDNPVDDSEFMGVYSTYKGQENNVYDLYYLAFNNGIANFKFDTFGARWQGNRDSLLWEFEGAYQSGDNSNGSNHTAGFWVAGLGRKFDCLRWKPTLWVYYDWASGGNALGAGNGFNHLFPLAHKYLGFMDLFGRSNLESPNVQLTFSPTEKLKVLCWYYYLFLESKSDTPYNLGMVPFNPTNAPVSADLGHEIDVTATYTINPRMNLLFGYSHFFSGAYYALTPGVPFRGDADFYYTQFQMNF